MDISTFISNFKNHPVLFVGTGMSLRYLENSYTWDGLLEHISHELFENDERYLDIKANHLCNGEYRYDEIATDIERIFNEELGKDRNGKFKHINDMFYDQMKNGIQLSRFKIYISEIFSEIKINPEKNDEIAELKKIRKDIGSVITTNYDKLIETLFEFNPLIENDILLSNPYGSVYKIHGCVDAPDKIIITQNDYNLFNRRYELIRAQLLSLFIHNPIIFIGYSIGDENIRNILKTIFDYVSSDSELAKKIQANFLLIEYEADSDSTEVFEHDITINSHTTIRVNKIKTDNFIAIYHALSELQLPISAMDVRKVQSIVKQIYEGGEIKVRITNDIDDLDNSSKVLAIGNIHTINYVYQNVNDMISNYFNIIEEENVQVLNLVDKQKIQENQYFPIFGFSKINSSIQNEKILKQNQKNKLKRLVQGMNNACKTKFDAIEEIFSTENVVKSNQINCLVYSILTGAISLDEAENYLKQRTDKKTTDYRKVLCAFDYMKYKDETDEMIQS